MTERNIFITQHDLDRLEELIAVARRTDKIDMDYLDHLDDALVAKTSVAGRAVPPDVVTMNSQVALVDPESGQEHEYSLVFPADANAAEGKISVLAPLGTALLGASRGQTIEWSAGGNLRRLRIEEILYQPEAAGDYHL